MEDKNRVICLDCSTSYDKKFLLGRQGNLDICPMCNGHLESGLDNNNSDHEKSPDNKNSEQDGWITWYYYGIKDKKGNKTDIVSLLDKPMDLERFGDTHYLIKEFQAPPRDENGNFDAVKKELRKYVPDAFSESKSVPKVQCPYCYSTEIQMVPKKFSLLTGEKEE